MSIRFSRMETICFSARGHPALSAGPLTKGQLSMASGTPSPSESRDSSSPYVDARSSGKVGRNDRGRAQRRTDAPLDGKRLLREIAQGRLQLELCVGAGPRRQPPGGAPAQPDLVAELRRSDVVRRPEAQERVS